MDVKIAFYQNLFTLFAVLVLDKSNVFREFKIKSGELDSFDWWRERRVGL